MARKRVTDLHSCKFSLNISGENKKTLDMLTTNYELKYGPMINYIIEGFFRMPECPRKIIENALLTAYTNLTNELSQTKEEFHRTPLERDRASCYEILRLLNGGILDLPPEIKAPCAMQKVKLADGYLLVPEDWIVLNPEHAESCHHAAVLECKNSAKYGIPHFIYLNNYQYENQYPDEMVSDFYARCRKTWPRFSEIEELNQRASDSSAEDYLTAPIIGLFNIAVQGDKSSEDYPYGAMIVKNPKNED